MHWVVHVYLESFYTSVQKDRRPELEANPLIILRHARVLDLCPRAKAAGVRLHSSRRHALQCCPRGEALEYAAEDYRQGASEILESCLEYTPVIEPIAENEFYLELAGPHTPDQVIRELTVRAVPALAGGLSAGIGKNKFLARAAHMALAAGRVNPAQSAGDTQDTRALLAEPAGRFYWLNREAGRDAAEFLHPLPVSYLWPLAENIKTRLLQLGFASINQVSSLDISLLQREFGAGARRIKALTEGEDPLPVLSLYPPKQLDRQVKFPSGVTDSGALEQSLARLTAELSLALSERGEGCRRLVLQVELEGGEVSRSRSFSRPQNQQVTLREVGQSLLKKISPASPVCALRVIADDLRGLHGAQLKLFEDPKALSGREKDWGVKLDNLITNLSQRFPPENFRLGRELDLSRREQMLQFWDPLRFAEKGFGK